ncbi:MAG: MMPL family transporter [Solirubrobacteraceae bacterium]|nr:MMPL family transporter [Solirubrobacteraceae bacterium]
MRPIARFMVRHARLVLVAWLAVFAVALLFASTAQDNIRQPSLRIPGSEAARAGDLTTREFEGTISMAVLLSGPPEQVERQGPKVVRELQEIEGVQVLSPWAIGGARVLREPDGQALIALQVKRPFDEVSEETVPEVQRVLADTVTSPVTSEITGLAPLVRALNEASIDSLHKGELIALPILLVMLLLIFRSPIAALVPALAGLLVTRVGIALMGLVNEVIDVDALSLNLVTMIGLALGVDYSLLVVSRFREELARGLSKQDAAVEACSRAGRTVLIAGAALSIAMACAALVAPGSLLLSSAVGVIVATIVAVLVALSAMPAGLAVLGAAVNRWQFWKARERQGRENLWVRTSERLVRSPALAAFLVLLPLAALTAPALALDTGPPNVANLPPDDPARVSYEAFERERGAGWSTPYEVLFHTDGSITTEKALEEITDFQEQAAELDGVEAVIGPSALLERAAILRRITDDVVKGSKQTKRFESGLSRTKKGTGQLADGLEAGAQGADKLVDGLGQAADGSQQIAGGAAAAAPQTQRLAEGVRQTSLGADKLSGGLSQVSKAVKDAKKQYDILDDSLQSQNRRVDDELVDPVARVQSANQAALRALGSIRDPAIANDPGVVAAKAEVAKALADLGPLKSNISNYASEISANATASREIRKGIAELSDALVRLDSGSRQLADGIDLTADGSQQLANGVGQLSGATAQLSSGLSTLLNGPNGNDGAKALAAGLDEAAAGSRRLGRAVKLMLDSVVTVRTRQDATDRQLERNGTDIRKVGESGYFVLAAIEGAQPQTQTNAAFATNTRRGGNTARVIVVPEQGPFDPQSADLRPELERLADETAQAIGAEAVVGGPAVVLDDFDTETSARIPLLVLVLSLATFLVLLLTLRSPVLALLAVLLNLVTVGASVGVLVLGFQGDDPLFGGPGYLDAIALMGVFAVVFGLSIDYQVFLISRLLEGRVLTGTTEGAIHHGLEKTAGIIAGAAAIMAAVFLAFAISPVMNTRQFGIGLTVAVLLDATVVRLVLLPALVKMFGERTWWVPRWLGGGLPRSLEPVEQRAD